MHGERSRTGGSIAASVLSTGLLAAATAMHTPRLEAPAPERPVRVGRWVTLPIPVVADRDLTDRDMSIARHRAFVSGGKGFSHDAGYHAASLPSSGRVQSGSVLGLPAAQGICERAAGGAYAHVCHEEELRESESFGINVPRGRYNPDAPGSAPPEITMPGLWRELRLSHVDCNAWTDDARTSSGVVWPGGGPKTTLAPCNEVLPFLCCDR